MTNADYIFLKHIVQNVQEWGEIKKREGFIPTTDLFVSEMTEHIAKLDEHDCKATEEDGCDHISHIEHA